MAAACHTDLSCVSAGAFLALLSGTAAMPDQAAQDVPETVQQLNAAFYLGEVREQPARGGSAAVVLLQQLNLCCWQ